MDWAYAQNQREFNIDSTIYMRFIVDASASTKKGHNDPIACGYYTSGYRIYCNTDTK